MTPLIEQMDAYSLFLVQLAGPELADVRAGLTDDLNSTDWDSRR